MRIIGATLAKLPSSHHHVLFQICASRRLARHINVLGTKDTSYKLDFHDSSNGAYLELTQENFLLASLCLPNIDTMLGIKPIKGSSNQGQNLAIFSRPFTLTHLELNLRHVVDAEAVNLILDAIGRLELLTQCTLRHFDLADFCDFQPDNTSSINLGLLFSGSSRIEVLNLPDSLGYISDQHITWSVQHPESDTSGFVTPPYLHRTKLGIATSQNRLLPRRRLCARRTGCVFSCGKVVLWRRGDDDKTPLDHESFSRKLLRV